MTDLVPVGGTFALSVRDGKRVNTEHQTGETIYVQELIATCVCSICKMRKPRRFWETKRNPAKSAAFAGLSCSFLSTTLSKTIKLE